jgi:hypothetical protein
VTRLDSHLPEVGHKHVLEAVVDAIEELHSIRVGSAEDVLPLIGYLLCAVSAQGA